MSTSHIDTLFGPDGLQARLRVAADAPDAAVAPAHYFTIPLPNDAHGIRALADAHLIVAAFGDPAAFGALPPRIAAHFVESVPDAQCPACKLLGRVLAAQGRRRPTDAEHRAASIVPIGVTRDGLDKAAAERVKREADRAKYAPQLARVARDAPADLF